MSLNAHDHPYEFLYLMGVALGHAWLLMDLAKNGRRDPDNKVPPGGYLAWAMATWLWPAVAAFFALVLLTD
jgi:hypothetical protein